MRRDRFFASYAWLILRNLLGWILIVASFVAGPLVPGPGGIPLFLIGFALISFPGKRRLTARVLRGRTVSVPPLSSALTSLAIAVIVPALLLILRWNRPQWAARVRRSAYDSGALGTAALYLTLTIAAWVIARTAPHALNGVIRLIARARHKFRPVVTSPSYSSAATTLARASSVRTWPWAAAHQGRDPQVLTRSPAAR